jgi:C4-dicarboxylate-specific signal transduction histidine kinase
VGGRARYQPPRPQDGLRVCWPGLAHDFNNVLATIAQAAHIKDTEVRHCEHDHPMLRIIQNATHRGAEIVSNIRAYLRGGREERTRINMRRLLNDVLQLAWKTLAK